MTAVTTNVPETTFSETTTEATTTTSHTTEIPKEEFITIKCEKYSTISQKLDLSKTDLTNKGIKEFYKMTNLTYLYLANYISDANKSISDISPLSGLDTLKHLKLHHTNITDSNIEWLKEKIPNCDIDYF